MFFFYENNNDNDDDYDDDSDNALLNVKPTFGNSVPIEIQESLKHRLEFYHHRSSFQVE